MIDLGRMNPDLTTGREQDMFAMMKNTMNGKDATDRFFRIPVPVTSEPVVDFNKWNEQYLQSAAQPDAASPVQQQMVEQPVIEKKDDAFDFDKWLNQVSGTSVKNDQQVNPVVAEQPQQIQAKPVETIQAPDINELMNRSYTVLGQTAQQRGYNPDEIVELAKNVTPDDLIDLYEMRKYQEQQRNSKPVPGPSTIGDPSNYRVQNNQNISIAGYGAKNVKI